MLSPHSLRAKLSSLSSLGSLHDVNMRNDSATPVSLLQAKSADVVVDAESSTAKKAAACATKLVRAMATVVPHKGPFCALCVCGRADVCAAKGCGRKPARVFALSAAAAAADGTNGPRRGYTRLQCVEHTMRTPLGGYPYGAAARHEASRCSKQNDHNLEMETQQHTSKPVGAPSMVTRMERVAEGQTWAQPAQATSRAKTLSQSEWASLRARGENVAFLLFFFQKLFFSPKERRRRLCLAGQPKHLALSRRLEPVRSLAGTVLAVA